MQLFYQMDADAKPQWVVAYPEADSPRTGDGLFAGEIIEVLQVSLGARTRSWPKPRRGWCGGHFLI